MNTLCLVLSHNYVITINQYLNQCLHLVLFACILSDEKARKTFYKKVAMCSDGADGVTIFIFLAIIKFLSPRKLFTYLKRRRNEDEIVILNETFRVRCRLNNVSSNLRFLSECLFRGVVPKRISIRVKKMRAHHSLKLERAMIRDEISKVSEEKEKLRLKYRRYMSEVRSFLGC